MDVPPEGDCWLFSVLAPLLGYIVVKEADKRTIFPTVRSRMSEIVLTDPNQFLHLFGGNQQELEDWTKKIKKWSPQSSREKWGGMTEFEIFAQITGICVHVINKENQSFEPTVQHHVPRTFPRKSWMDEDWTVSVVVVKTWLQQHVVTETRRWQHSFAEDLWTISRQEVNKGSLFNE